MLPEKFDKRMADILGEGYSRFSAALEEPSVRGIRVNESKISVESFLSATDIQVSKIEYTPDGFIPECADGIGSTPEHHAGMFYVQDPGAMATVCALEIEKGWRVLDACSAPGGKSSQISSRIGDGGFLLANEFVPKRAKIIVSNFERLGIKNAMVLSQNTAKFKEMFTNFFDLVICDAPCSGEGMFRKYDEALTEWSEENVKSSAERQREILSNLAPLVKKGGYLLYSTCTYSLEENEENIADFLQNNKDYRLTSVSPALLPYTADGIEVEGLSATEAAMCRRFYPHLAKGEGQFIALLQRVEAGEPEILYRDEAKPLTKGDEAIVKAFFKENMKKVPEGRLVMQADFAVLVPHGFPIPKYSVFMSGVVVGEIKKGRLEPHHQFFSTYGKDMNNIEVLSRGDTRVSAYLRGEEIEAKSSVSGYCAVLYEGCSLGGGKVSQGRIKNHYPKGLRNK